MSTKDVPLTVVPAGVPDRAPSAIHAALTDVTRSYSDPSV
jgi:hypothetical protein